MKLRTCLVTGFLMVTLIPLLLFAVTLHGVKMAQEKSRPVMQSSDSEQVLITDAGKDYDISIDSGDFPDGRIHLTTKGIFLAAFLILVCTAVVVGGWIYRRIAVPLAKLREATDNIKNGNLDFVLETDGIAEISDLCRDFEDMRLRLKDSAEEKIRMDQENRDLIRNISHDLKTPLTAIKGYVEGIMDGVASTPDQMERYVKTIYNKTLEMDRLINELTFYSGIDTNRIPYTFSRLSVREYFDDCAFDLKLELDTKHIRLEYTNHVSDEVRIIADGEQLRRVIQNIINNSVKYMDLEKDSGIIWLRVMDAGDFIQVEIEDNGRGISQKNLSSIFDRFYRTDASRNSSSGGSGIGLSIVKKIIEDHSGKVWASSREGKGTTIIFVLRKA